MDKAALEAFCAAYGVAATAALPGALCGREYPEELTALVLFAPWRPLFRRDKGGPTLCGYYPVSNRLYHGARALEAHLTQEGCRVLRADSVALKPLLARAKLAAVGRNGLAAVEGYGSFFAVQLLLTDAFLPDGLFALRPAPCTDCGLCQGACVSGCIGQRPDYRRCIRAHMDGQPLEGFVFAGLRQLLGCDLCQRVCPRNGQVTPAPMDPALCALFTWERLLFLNKTDREAIAAVVGKNLLSRGRLRSQALLLAAKNPDPALRALAGEAAALYENSPLPALASAARLAKGCFENP